MVTFSIATLKISVTRLHCFFYNWLLIIFYRNLGELNAVTYRLTGKISKMAATRSWGMRSEGFHPIFFSRGFRVVKLWNCVVCPTTFTLWSHKRINEFVQYPFTQKQYFWVHFSILKLCKTLIHIDDCYGNKYLIDIYLKYILGDNWNTYIYMYMY